MPAVDFTYNSAVSEDLGISEMRGVSVWVQSWLDPETSVGFWCDNIAKRAVKGSSTVRFGGIFTFCGASDAFQLHFEAPVLTSDSKGQLRFKEMSDIIFNFS